MKRLLPISVIFFLAFTSCSHSEDLLKDDIPTASESGAISENQITVEDQEFAISSTQEVPILMYHYVRYVDKDTDPIGWNLSVTPELLEDQLAYLKNQGYTGIHLSDLVDGKIPDKPIIMSFDDGHKDFYTEALPLLQKYDFTASSAIVTGFIANPAHLNLEEIEKVLNAGIEITSHTITHADLETSSSEEVRRQIRDSKAFLEEKLDVDIRALVYPAGRYDEEAVEILKEHGYEVAVTTEYGVVNLLEDDMLLLPRIRIDNRDGLEGFKAKLDRGNN